MRQRVTSQRENPLAIQERAVTTVERAWMVDVDGVLLTLITKQEEAFIIDVLAYRLRCGEPVTFHSDRSLPSISDRIVARLEERLMDKALLSRIMLVGEKGGTWATYAPNGTLTIAYDPALSVPLALKAAIGELAVDPEFEPLMTVEGGKRTMLSVVKRPSIPLAPFHLVQPQFARLARQYIGDLGFSSEWKIDVVSDAVEIEHRSADKGKGVHRVMQWLQVQGIWPWKVTVIEESPSGLVMADTLYQLQVPTEFIFTGGRDLPQRDYPFPVIRTQSCYEQGTIEYLTQYHERFALPLPYPFLSAPVLF